MMLDALGEMPSTYSMIRTSNSASWNHRTVVVLILVAAVLVIACVYKMVMRSRPTPTAAPAPAPLIPFVNQLTSPTGSNAGRTIYQMGLMQNGVIKDAFIVDMDSSDNEHKVFILSTTHKYVKMKFQESARKIIQDIGNLKNGEIKFITNDLEYVSYIGITVTPNQDMADALVT